MRLDEEVVPDRVWSFAERCVEPAPPTGPNAMLRAIAATRSRIGIMCPRRHAVILPRVLARSRCTSRRELNTHRAALNDRSGRFVRPLFARRLRCPTRCPCGCVLREDLVHQRLVTRPVGGVLPGATTRAHPDRHGWRSVGAVRQPSGRPPSQGLELFGRRLRNVQVVNASQRTPRVCGSLPAGR